MPKLLTEFVGTFFLVLVILLAGPRAGPMAPIAIGLILMAMVYMGGHISGAHYNPAVTLAIIIRGKMRPAEGATYWVAQLLAAFGAAALAHYFNPNPLFPVPPALTSEPPPPSDIATKIWIGAALVEVLFTFALALVVLNVATAKTLAGNSFYGVAIGLTVTAAAFAAGPISGGAFNPAVGTGPALFAVIAGNSKGLAMLPLYILAPCAGGALAAIVFRIQNPAEQQPQAA